MIQTPPTPLCWSSLIEQQVRESFYHRQDWIDLIARRYGYSSRIFTTRDVQGEITGILPLCFMQSPLTGRRLVGLPFSDHCPLIAADSDSATQLVNQAIEFAQTQRVRYLELRTGAHPVLAQRSDMVASNLYVRWLVPLTPDPDTIWTNLRKPVQRQIKKSQKLGVTVRIAQQRQDMALYYQLHLLTRSKLGMPAQSPQFFFDLWDTFAAQNTLLLLLAEYQGNTIAGMLLLASGKTVRYSYGASDENSLALAPNNLLLWKALTWSCEQGYQSLDLGRTAVDNQGLMEFKRRWGAVQEELPYYYYPHKAGLAATAESSRTYRLLTNCWKKLPLQIAGPLGGYLYKHLG